MRLFPKTLFGRTAAALLTVFLVFEVIAFAVTWTQIVEPLTRRAADDLAAKILLAAQTWVELPPQTRADFENELSFRHGLELGEATDKLTQPAPRDYFLSQIAAAMTRRAGHPVQLKSGPDPAWAWADLHVGETLLRVGFERESYVFAAPLVAAGVFLLGAVLTIITALLMVLRASRQLKGLADKAHEVGQGRTPARLPETGAQELKDLTSAFNLMAEEVRALLENRTVLLAGISHDLRTPITRLRLALSMLEDPDSSLVVRMERDLDEMNKLITDMLVFARAFKVEGGEVCDLVEVLKDLVEQSRRLGLVEWDPPESPCWVRLSIAAVRRVVGNLLDNARRYGGGNPAQEFDAAVRITLECDAQQIRLCVSDHGPGIPVDQRDAVFRPFYRLEGSRSRDGGGSGLGLAIAKQLTDAQGWRIELADNVGGGLAASVILPASVRESVIAAAEAGR